MNKPKRYRTVHAKPGEIRVFYGKADRYCELDVCYAWGPDTSKSDTWLLHTALTEKRLTLDFPNTGHKWEHSVLDELKRRGYDITTLKFSIQKTRSTAE